MSRARTFPVAVAMLAFAGPAPAQTVQPAPAPPAPEAPAAPSSEKPEDAGSAAPTSAPHDRHLDFMSELADGDESLSADEVAARAVKTAPTIARAQAAAEQASKAAAQSVVSLYPRLDLIAEYRRLSRPPLIVYPLPPGLVTGYSAVAFPRPLKDQYLLQARVSYPVSDLFLTILPRYRAARDSAEAQKLRTRVAELDVSLAAREAYYNYARARAALLVARFGVSTAEAQYKDILLLVETASQPPVELRRAEANLSAARVSVARSEGALTMARAALRTLLHRSGDSDIAVVEDLTQVLPPLKESEQSVLQRALANRSELRALRLTAQAQQREAGAREADKLPKLALAATAEEGNPNPRAALFEREWRGTWSAWATLSWSPNDFAVGDLGSDQAAAERAQTLAEIAQLEDALRLEVSQAYSDYATARKAMEAALTGIEAAEEGYRVRRQQLRADAAIATDVIIAEGDLVRSRLDLINAAIDLRIARARLNRVAERREEL